MIRCPLLNLAVSVPEAWQIVGLGLQARIVEDLGFQKLDGVGDDLGESNEAAVLEPIEAVEIPPSERRIAVDASGAITIPAAACTRPVNNTDVVRFMPSELGGMQWHMTRFAGTDTIRYDVNVPKAGKYHLTARLVTPASKQHLFLRVNGARERIDIPLPYTVGMWGELQPVAIDLKAGANQLAFSRGHCYQRGVTLKKFKLVPIQ